MIEAIRQGGFLPGSTPGGPPALPEYPDLPEGRYADPATEEGFFARHKKPILITVGSLALVVLAGGGIYLATRNKQKPSQPSAAQLSGAKKIQQKPKQKATSPLLKAATIQA